MIKIEYTNSFKKSLTLMLKRGKDKNKLTSVIKLLVQNMEQGIPHYSLLPGQYKLHKMVGQYNGHWDCHIENDWILIFLLEDNLLRLVRTCSHSDFMNKNRK
jgi:mRNA interferase YafQ